MSNKPKIVKSSVPEIIHLFGTDPEFAYQSLINSGHYFYSKQTDRFWNEFSSLNLIRLSNKFPKSVPTFNKIIWLKLYHDLNSMYKSERARHMNTLLALNPSETALTKALFLCLELGEHSYQPTELPNYSEESLEAIKVLLHEILPQLKNEKKSEYTVNLFNNAYALIKLEMESSILREFLDMTVWANLEVSKSTLDKGFELKLAPNDLKSNNLLVLNHLKTQIKRDFKKVESKPMVSNEDHFLKNDPTWKTQEGLATVFYSSGVTITNQTPGTTALELKDPSLFTNLMSEDLQTSEEALLKFALLHDEQNFHLRFRQALSKIYQPNDEIDIHALQIEIEKNIFISLYELLCGMSCLIARADALRYLNDDPRSGSIKTMKRRVYEYFSSSQTNLSVPELEKYSHSEIANNFNKIDETHKYQVFTFVSKEKVLSWFSKIEELNTKTPQELEAMLNLFSRLDSPLPIIPLYKIDGKYHFSHATCTSSKVSLNQLLYDNYISDKLFNPNNKSIDERRPIADSHQNRERRFNNSMKELFSKFTEFVEAGLKFGDEKSLFDFGHLKGEFDVIAYFKDENIIIPIQVKLSNVSPRTEKRKSEWITNQLREKAINQVIKDVKLLRTKAGLRFIEEKLNVADEIKDPKIYPIIITDNFFADHVSFALNENGDHVLCISYFELKHLLSNQKIHDKQANWLPFEIGDNVASRLIDAIEKNAFWNFLGEFAEKFELTKSIESMGADNKITLKI